MECQCCACILGIPFEEKCGKYFKKSDANTLCCILKSIYFDSFVKLTFLFDYMLHLINIL